MKNFAQLNEILSPKTHVGRYNESFKYLLEEYAYNPLEYYNCLGEVVKTCPFHPQFRAMHYMDSTKYSLNVIGFWSDVAKRLKEVTKGKAILYTEPHENLLYTREGFKGGKANLMLIIDKGDYGYQLANVVYAKEVTKDVLDIHQNFEEIAGKCVPLPNTIYNQKCEMLILEVPRDGYYFHGFNISKAKECSTSYTEGYPRKVENDYGVYLRWGIFDSERPSGMKEYTGEVEGIVQTIASVV